MPIVLPSPTRPHLTEPTFQKPPAWKPILAWAAAVIGGLIVVAAVATFGDGVRESVGMLLIGVGIAIPGGWWIYCEHTDRSRAEEDFRLDQQAARAEQAMSGVVAPTALAPLTWDTPLVPTERRWLMVGMASAALVLAGGIVSPSVETEPAAASPVRTPAATTMTTTRTTTATTLPPTSAAVTEPATVTVTEVAVAETAAVPAQDPSSTARAYVPAAPAYSPAPTYAPAPLAAVPQAASYSNCSEARAAGAAPLYRGQPGYAPKLDRDNDGVACE